jgi:hypothetical protein
MTTDRTKRRRRWLVVGVALLLLVPFAVVAGVVWATRIRPQPYHDAMTAHALAGACGSTTFEGWGRDYFPDAAPYEGSAPHPVHVVIENPEESGQPESSYDAMGWRDASPEVMRSILRPETVQLVACLDWTDDGEQISSCDYQDHPSVPVRSAGYDLTVYETRTGDEVGTDRIEDARSTQCPRQWIFQGDDPAIFAAPTVEQLDAALEPFTDVDK